MIFINKYLTKLTKFTFSLYYQNADGCVIPKLIAIPDPKQEEESHSSDECDEEAAKAEKCDKAAPPLLIPDLLVQNFSLTVSF